MDNKVASDLALFLSQDSTGIDTFGCAFKFLERVPWGGLAG